MNRLLCAFLTMFAAAAGVIAAEENPPLKQLNDLSGPWQLFIDDYVIASKQNITRKYHPFEKYPNNPVVVNDKPWEGAVVKVATVMPSEEGTFYRMWYGCWAPLNDPDRGHSMYATSRDGINWYKPDLGLTEWKVDSSKHNNMAGGGASIIHTPWNKDPDQKYTAFSSGSYRVSTSPDGLNWKRLSDEYLVRGGDVGRFHWDVFTKHYRGYVKIGANVSGLRRRAVGFSQGGPNILTWPPLRLVMAPDDIDDRWAKPGSVLRTHFYGVAPFNYQTMYLGLLWVFRADDPDGYFLGPLFAELVSSRDGIHWKREEGDRPPVLKLGPPGSWDAGMVFPVFPTMLGNRIATYYTGYDGPHDTFPFQASIGLATMRKDGFVSMDAGDSIGEVTTKRFQNFTGDLHINCDAKQGSLQIEVLDAGGTVLPGYSRSDCDPVIGDQLDHVVTWSGKKNLPGNTDTLRLRFVIRSASLYSFVLGDKLKIVDEPTGPILQALYTFEDDHGGPMADKLTADGAQELRRLSTSKINWKAEEAAFGQHSMIVHSPWRPLNHLKVLRTTQIGTHFTLAAMVKSEDHKHARLFSAADGRTPVNCSELLFDFDPSGKVIEGLRLFCKGIPVESDPVTFADDKYHHLAAVYDDGPVRFYLDGKEIGEKWLPGGAPIALARDLLIGENAYLSSCPAQLTGQVDDVVILGRAMSADEVASLARDGAEAFFAITDQSAK